MSFKLFFLKRWWSSLFSGLKVKSSTHTYLPAPGWRPPSVYPFFFYQRADPFFLIPPPYPSGIFKENPSSPLRIVNLLLPFQRRYTRNGTLFPFLSDARDPFKKNPPFFLNDFSPSPFGIVPLLVYSFSRTPPWFAFRPFFLAYKDKLLSSNAVPPFFDITLSAPWANGLFPNTTPLYFPLVFCFFHERKLLHPLYYR